MTDKEKLIKAIKERLEQTKARYLQADEKTILCDEKVKGEKEGSMEWRFFLTRLIINDTTARNCIDEMAFLGGLLKQVESMRDEDEKTI